jgi:uncharacterized BrkB/YihY/UPF0761 family membrane protein
MLSRLPHDPTAYDDDWEDQPAQRPFYKWALGVAVLLVILGFGLHAISTGEAVYGGQMKLTLHGINADAFGVAAVSAAVFMHCHYFWGNVYDQAWFAVLGKIIAAIGFIVGLGVLLIRFGLFGIK